MSKSPPSKQTASLLSAEWSDRLMKSIKANPGKVFFTLGTIGLDGSPRARVMTLPNIKEPAGEISLGTSKESAKWQELSNDPRFEICFYFHTTEEQYRMRGDQIKLEGLEKEVWDATPSQFKKPFEDKKAKTGKDTFGVIQFLPNHCIEHTDLKTKEKTTA